MIRLLAIIAGVGLLMSAVCITAAVAIGGPDAIAHGAWSLGRGGWERWSWSHMNDGHMEGGRWAGAWSNREDARGPSASRDFPWSGGADLTVNAPAEVDYVQAPGAPKLTISGPPAMLARLQVRGGEISLPGALPYGGRLHIVLHAPGVRHFALNGAGQLAIKDYDQDELAVDISGHGQVDAAGRTKSLKLSVSGAGEGDFGELKTAGADIDISGAGQATIDPSEWAKVQISGVGDVELLNRPPRLETHVSGAGHVRLPDSDESDDDEPKRAV